jgi:secreted trypsin-like serine protease
VKLFSTLVAALVLATVAAPSAQAIMGPTPGTQIYFVTSVQESVSMGQSPHLCGGVLVADTWVLTAKQCVASRTPGSMTVRAGSRNHKTGGELVPAADVVPHPTSDVALVRLSKRVSPTPVAVAEKPSAEGTYATVAGWGQTCPEFRCSGPTDELQEVLSVVGPSSDCTTGQICTKHPSGGGPCYGDEGGPLAVRHGDTWELIGLVPAWPSVGQSCSQGRSAAIDVTALRDWIIRYTG